MRIRPSVVIALGVGYVLGARAGREQYDAIMRQAREIRERPEVQGAAGLISAQAGAAFQRARGLLGIEPEPPRTLPFRPLAAHSSNGVSSVSTH
ncbi:hypothetical protein MXD59_14850 [Frankia sp. Ag45/Mut15]|uniref:Secreted protein n=1 Tax=Frankia umida TaxID=573489 RepID=A0ABT0JZT0_9ACTN|nr:hypothetical protein [Frankia umida]MCK9877036.1 hypothetical protein [Frankia umida]